MVKFIGFTKKEFLLNFIHLFRFTNIERLLEHLESGDFAFMNPSTWEDPYERYYIEKKYTIKRRSTVLPIKDNVFCICLSGTSNSEAYWKVYASKENGVRLTFNTKQLLKALDKIVICDFYIGRVNYQTTEEFAKLDVNVGRLITEINSGVIGKQQLLLLLKKRKSFSYENELRIIAVPKISIKDNEVFKIKLDIKEFTTYFLLDPRSGRSHHGFLRKHLKKDHGIIISRSSLYKEPPLSTLVLK